MKKLMMTLAAGLSATALLAVNSENIVGYQTVGTVAGKLNMPALQFQAVGDGEIAINDMFTDVSGLTKGNGTGDADSIRVWNPVTSGYTQYFLYTDTGGYYPASEGKWVKYLGGSANPTTDTLPTGSAFWLNRVAGSDVDLTTHGEVALDASFNFTITKGKLNMIGNPYPTAIAINSANFAIDATKAVKGNGTGDADSIRVWNPATSGYAQYFLYTDTGGYYPASEGKWVKYLGGSANPTTDTLPAGFGAWYNSVPATTADWTLTINKTF